MPILAGSSLSISTRGWPVFRSRLRSGSSIGPEEPRAARPGIARTAARTSSARPRQAGALRSQANLTGVILIDTLQVETNNPKKSTADSHQIPADSSPFVQRLQRSPPYGRDYALIRFGYGAGSDLMRRPPRVLGKIPEDLLDEWNLRPHGQRPFAADPCIRGREIAAHLSVNSFTGFGNRI
jgi:hypothetical protein